jgi:hypothetical protein
MGIPTLRTCHFEASEEYHNQIYLTSSSCHKNQTSKSWWEWPSGNSAFLIPALWNIDILHHKQTNRTKQFDGECSS